MAYHREAKSDYRSQALLHKGEQSSGNLFLLDKPFAQQLKRLVEKKLHSIVKSSRITIKDF